MPTMMFRLFSSQLVIFFKVIRKEEAMRLEKNHPHLRDKPTIVPSFTSLFILLSALCYCHHHVYSFSNYGSSKNTFKRIKAFRQYRYSNTALGVAEDINGKAIAQAIRAELKKEIETLKVEKGTTPGLAVILVGERRDSQTYVRMKTKACEQVGMASFQFDYDETASQNVLMQKITELNANPKVHGILVQLPLPKHINEETILNSVAPDKDVDGLHPTNVARLTMLQDSISASNDSAMPFASNFSIPCTPLGCMELLLRSGVEISGKHAVVIGRSNLVGLPMYRLLLAADATVTVVHSRTQDIAEIVRQGDIVIAAIGKAQLVKKNWLKKGSVVIDIGINSVDVESKEPGSKPYKLVGDVDYAEARQLCSKITPVPGGVGPMTIAMLLRNTVNACSRSLNNL